MTQTEWIIVIVGGVIAMIIMVAASENEKRLNRIIRLLEVANEELRYPNLEAHKRDMMGDSYDYL